MASETPSLAQLIDPRTREGELSEPLPDGRLRCYACGHRCPIPEGREALPRPLQRRRNPPRPARLRRRAAVRPDREEALLPRPAGLRRPLLRDARLRSALRLLPELVHVSVDPRSRGRGRPARRHGRPAGTARVRGGGRRRSSRPTTSRSSPRSGRSRSSGRRSVAACARATSPTATARREVLDYIRPWVDFYKVDLKSMDDKHYRQLGGVLAERARHDRGIHERGLLARGADARDSRLQRLRRGAAEARRPSSPRSRPRSRGT